MTKVSLTSKTGLRTALMWVSAGLLVASAGSVLAGRTLWTSHVVVAMAVIICALIVIGVWPSRGQNSTVPSASTEAATAASAVPHSAAPNEPPVAAEATGDAPTTRREESR